MQTKSPSQVQLTSYLKSWGCDSSSQKWFLKKWPARQRNEGIKDDDIFFSLQLFSLPSEQVGTCKKKHHPLRLPWLKQTHTHCRISMTTLHHKQHIHCWCCTSSTSHSECVLCRGMPCTKQQPAHSNINTTKMTKHYQMWKYGTYSQTTSSEVLPEGTSVNK